MKLYLVRHPQTDANKQEMMQGQGIDLPMNQTGHWQAKQLAMRLEPERLDFGYSSDLKRAKVAACKIAMSRSPVLKLKFMPELRERNLGDYEGTLISQGRYAQGMASSGLGFADFCPPGGGESWAQLQQRMVSCFQGIARRHPHQSILIMSHGAALTTLCLYLLGEKLTRQNQLARKPKNASLSVIHWDVDQQLGWAELFNDTTHLE